MSAPISVNDLSHEEISAWLERALRGREPLPGLTPDESPFLGILRLEKTLKPAARDSLRDGCFQLVRQFCADGREETAYTEELLSLTSAFKNPEAVQMLAQLALRFPQMPQIPLEIRLAVLAALVDTPPPQEPVFWKSVFEQAPEEHAGLALSGVLATNPARAIGMLPAMPDVERIGQATALKLDLAWDDLPPGKRVQFVEDVEAALARCGPRFADPVRAWTGSKGASANPSLLAALRGCLDGDVAPRTRSPKLYPREAA